MDIARLKLILLIVLICMPNMVNAGAGKSSQHSTPNLADTDWHYRVIPYVWMINMDGTTQIGRRRAHINQNFGDILSHLSFAGMIWLEAEKGNLGIFLNSLYSVLKDTAHDGALSLDAKNRFGLFTAGVSYKVYQANNLSLIPFAGFRYTLNDNQMAASTPAITVNAKDNQNWIDPLVGARLIYAFHKAWSGTLEVDIGGTSATTDYSYNVNALVGYHLHTVMTHTTIYFGYRLLDQNYQTGNGSGTYVWNMRIAGPILGIAFDF
jgi:hypothetical protein